MAVDLNISIADLFSTGGLTDPEFLCSPADDLWFSDSGSFAEACNQDSLSDSPELPTG